MSDSETPAGKRTTVVSRPVRRILFFRVSPHMSTLVFAPPERAQFIDQVHRAIEESTTWGEFRKRMPKGEYRELFADVFSADPEELEEDEELREPGLGPTSVPIA